MIDGT